MGANRKRRNQKKSGPADSDEEVSGLMNCEKKARYVKDADEATPRGKKLLPIKLADGTFQAQFMEIAEETGMNVADEVEKEAKHDVVKEKPKIKFPKTLEEIKWRRKQIIAEKKKQIVSLQEKIQANPQHSLKHLKELRMLVEDHEYPECCATIRKLAVGAMTQVLVDILPDYRIRERSEQEQEQTLSKETKQLVEYEEGLLKNYQLYLKSLDKIIRRRKVPGDQRMMSASAQKSLGIFAIRSIAALYTNTMYFNFHKNVATLLVSCAYEDEDQEIRMMCCKAVRQLFRRDTKGQATCETVEMIAKLYKGSANHNLTTELLEALLSLRINRVDYSMLSKRANKEERKKYRDNKKKMSRRDRKKLKQSEVLNQELKEVRATEDVDERTKFNTQTVTNVFWVYFRILKAKKTKTRMLLPLVLRGLSDFAHLINIEFFSDLLHVLEELVRTSDLTLSENLDCITAAFKILSGLGESLNIDPAQFYNLTHKLLYDIPMVTNNKDCDAEVGKLVECLDMMIVQRRKQITMTCLCAFVKRSIAASAQVSSTKSALILIGEARKLLDLNTKTSAMFLTESQDIGVYNMLENDPQHTSSTSSVAWGLHLQRRHYVPEIKQAAVRLLMDGKKRVE